MTPIVEVRGDGAAALVGEIIGTLQEPFLALDAEGRITGASEAFATTFGFAPDLLPGRRLEELGPGGWGGEELRSVLLESASVEMIGGRELELPSAAGELLRARVNVRPLRRGVDELTGYLLSFRLSAAPESNGDAQPGLARLAALHGSDLVALYRPDGRCVFVGPGCESALGYSRLEWLELQACDHLHRVDQEACRSALSGQRLGAEPQRFPARVRARTGEYVWLDLTLRAVEHPVHGPLLHVRARESTRERRAEEALRWLARQMRLILDSAGEGIFGVDARGVVTFANPAAARLLHRSVGELMGQSYRQFAPDAEEIQATLADGLDRVVSEREFSCGDAPPIVVELTCTPARLHGSVVGAVVTFRDVSERRRAEEAVRRARWLAGIEQTVLALRHEINNPLTALLAEVSLLEMGGNTPAEEREMVASIADQARRIRDVIRRLTECQERPVLRSDSSRPMLDLSS
jgi:PAS domain S-box-containing protein